MWGNNYIFLHHLVMGPSSFSHRFSQEMGLISLPLVAALGLRSFGSFLVPGLEWMWDSSCGWASAVLGWAVCSRWKEHRLGHQTHLGSESSSTTCELCDSGIIFLNPESQVYSSCKVQTIIPNTSGIMSKKGVTCSKYLISGYM